MFTKLRDFLKTKRDSLIGCIFGLPSSEQSLRKERRSIFFLVFVLTLIGLLFIYESSSLYSLRYRGDPAHFFKRQSLFFIISLAVFYSSLFLDLDFIKQKSKIFFICLILILAIVPIFGQRIGGARRWIGLAGFNFQPSELLKVFFLIYCADYCSRKETVLKDLRRGLIPILLTLFLISFLLLLQPDLGAVIFWAAWLLIFVYLFGAKIKHLFIILSGGIASLIFLIMLYPYRMRRITAYLNPFADPLDSGFQLIQSQLAYGRGGLFGAGFGAGRQKLFFLPAAHTDFIFSIIAEELGLFATLGILVIFFIVIHKMFKIAKLFTDNFRKGLLSGIVIIFFLEVFFNIGVTCGLLPTKGAPLPFISYGGTSLVVHYFLLGLFFNASRGLVKSKDGVVTDS